MVEEVKIKGWKRKRLVDISPLQRGFDLTSLSIVEGNYPVVYSNGILKLHHRYMVKGPGVITGRSGTIGKVTFVEENYWPHNTSLWVTDFKGNHTKFIYYLLIYLRLERQASGSGVPTLNRNDIHMIEINIPNIEEQKAIAKVLTDTDNLIHSIEKLIDKKEKIKQGTMQELLTGKKRLDGFSGEWRNKALGDISDIRTGKKDNENKVEAGLYPFFVRSQHIERINSYSYDGEAILIPGEGGIGSIYHYINGKFDYHQRVYKISDFKAIEGKYVYYFMKQTFNEHAMKNSVKATVDSLRLPAFQEFEIYCPPSLEEQKAISKILSDMDQEIQGLKEKLEKYKTIKQGMMQELLTGRIRLI